MKIKAYWKSKNPFIPDITRLSYTKTIDVPDGMDLKELEQFAKADSKEGYRFDKLEVVSAYEGYERDENGYLLSPCCGEILDEDNMICPQCREHC